MALTFNNIHGFDPKQIGDLSGKVILITGGNTGLGFQSIRHLAPSNATIVFTSRSPEKAKNAIAEIKKETPSANLSFIQMDLSSFASVQAARRTFVQSHDRLDILIANAGIMNVPAELTKDGYEMQFGTNHMGHALLIKLLLPTLSRTAEQPGTDVRIILLTSEGHRGASTIDFKASKTPMDSWIPAWGYMRYGPSKLANLLYARQLAQRYPAITSVAIHPGVVGTDLVLNRSWLGRNFVLTTTRMLGMKMIQPAEGAFNQTWAGVAPKSQVKSGGYYLPVGSEGKLEKVVKEGKLEVELWDWTQQELKDWEL